MNQSLLKKLKYDLAMQCATLTVLNDLRNQANFDVAVEDRVANPAAELLENFEGFYNYYDNIIDQSNFENIMKFLES